MARKWYGTKPYVEYTSSTGGTSSNVTYDATGAGNSASSGSNSVNIQWSHTASGNNRIVVVGLMVGGISAAASTFTRTATYGGNSMTSAVVRDGTSTNGFVEMFYLLDPPTGAQTVSVTVSKASTSFGRVTANSVSYTNAESVSTNSNGSTSTSTANWFWIKRNYAGDSVQIGIIGIDSSSTISSIVANNAMYSSQAQDPDQGTTRWTSNSGSTSGFTSAMMKEMRTAMFNMFHINTSPASNYAMAMLDIVSVKTPVPAGVRGLWLTMIGCGGPGGSGRRGAQFSTRYGGDGGGGGATVSERYIPIEWLGTTYAVYVPPVATGGAAQSTNSTDGNKGLRALDVMFLSNFWTLSAGSGHPGNGGSTALPGYYVSGGNTADQNGEGARSGLGSSGSAAGTTADNTFWGNLYSGAGGGGGGGITSGNATSNGGAGSSNRLMGLTGGSGGTTGGGSPGAGSSAVAGIPGSGAGGGASSTSGAAQSGANATAYGAGGGGGGASRDSTGNSGAGGNGGPGYVRITWDFR